MQKIHYGMYKKMSRLLSVHWIEINIQKSTLFLYTSDQLEIKKFENRCNSIKKYFLQICLTKDVTDLTKNYKPLQRKIEDLNNKWREIPCSCIRMLDILTCFSL